MILDAHRPARFTLFSILYKDLIVETTRSFFLVDERRDTEGRASVSHSGDANFKHWPGDRLS
jgi:hypothetical protein